MRRLSVPVPVFLSVCRKNGSFGEGDGGKWDLKCRRLLVFRHFYNIIWLCPRDGSWFMIRIEVTLAALRQYSMLSILL